MPAAALRRSRIARMASPGLEAWDRSIFGRDSATALGVVPLRSPRKYARTRSAWSSSMELEWVLPETPMASSASRIGLLFTSSSRARSLILTLFIRPFVFLPSSRLAVHTSLVRSGSVVVPIMSEFLKIAAKSMKSGFLLFAAEYQIARVANHGRCPSRWFRWRLPGCHLPGSRWCRCRVRWPLRGHRPHRSRRNRKRHLLLR